MNFHKKMKRSRKDAYRCSIWLLFKIEINYPMLDSSSRPSLPPWSRSAIGSPNRFFKIQSLFFYRLFFLHNASLFSNLCENTRALDKQGLPGRKKLRLLFGNKRGNKNGNQTGCLGWGRKKTRHNCINTPRKPSVWSRSELLISPRHMIKQNWIQTGKEAL